MPYLNVNEVESALSVAASPPNHTFTQLITLPHSTWGGRTCHAIKFAGGTGAGRIGVYFIAGVHAREWGCPDILINFVEKMAQAYRTHSGLSFGGKSFSAVDIKKTIDELDIFVFPQVNPDGRHYSMSVDTCWRKNRRPISAGVGCDGVDINRNYDFLWYFPTYFSAAAGIVNSTSTCGVCNTMGYQVYIGPGAASEPETRNVVSLADDHTNIRFFIDVHSYAEKIFYNWGDDNNQTTNENMNFQNPAYNGQRGVKNDAAYREYIPGCDEAEVIALGNRMRGAIQAVRGRSYGVEQSMDLYPTAGTSQDYMFSRCFADKSKGKVRSYTVETGTQFQPPYAEMENIIEEVTAGLIEFCLGAVERSADVYIKDNPADTGTQPSAGGFWNNSDVIIRQSDDGIFTHDNARRGQPNYLYVRFTNRGPAAADTVKIRARAVRFPGTEFVYPQDWDTVDATHLAPTPILDSFTNVLAGGSRIAKFSLSAAQVDALWGWQSGGWHPCLLAEVDGCNDHRPPVGVHVWQDNNLGQRNISIVPALLHSLIAFPFVAGNVRNLSTQLELVVDRRQLPESVELLLDPFDRTRYFEGVVLDKPESRDTVTFLDRTRLEVAWCARDGILTLAPGSSFRCLGDPADALLGTHGASLVRRNGRTLIAITAAEAILRFRKQPGQMQQFVLHFKVSPSAKLGDVYRVHVMQRDEKRELVGGVTLEAPIVSEGLG